MKALDLNILFKVAFFFTLITSALPLWAQTNEDCMMCHEDMELASEAGTMVGVNPVVLQKSVHGDQSCTDCHVQPGDFEDVPHFQVYRKVNCLNCHEEATSSFKKSFHGEAIQYNKPGVPDCIKCHSSGKGSHSIQPLDLRSAENSCKQCHVAESKIYDTSVHYRAALEGKASAGCITCHPTHSEKMPPSAGAVNNLCESCHQGAMEAVRKSGHFGSEKTDGVISCVSCHESHGTHTPHLDKGTIQACVNCHPGINESFLGSVHETLFIDGDMNCLSCHKTHEVDNSPASDDFGCGVCHEDVEEVYRGSAHRLARLHGDKIAATCDDCHGAHKILSPADPESPASHQQIPNTCGKCHTDQAVITSDYVRLPISLPNYKESIHGTGWQDDKKTAVCSDCHGSHDLISASSNESTINKSNISTTCGKCHKLESREYNNSVHGRALAHGIVDSPSCIDCHDEHLIFKVDDSRSKVHPGEKASKTCASCHENPEMATKYGLPPEVIESYNDSYHGWAVKQGGESVASCIDCHNTHNIGSLLDPNSSIHPNHVVSTCNRCHPNANANFAASYTHILARDQMQIHDWVKIIYIFLIVGILGGMLVHNVIIFAHELNVHYRKEHDQPLVERMNHNEVIQHILLLTTFTVLAITGFALRFPDTWWVNIASEFGLDEEVRRITHRLMAFSMLATSVYHAYYLLRKKRGRMILKAVMPIWSDVTDAIKNVKYHLGFKIDKPVFGRYDYTQKAEYWALVWGTVLMTVTGFVLWFPVIATSWLPSWSVRVCEVIHFYEAILAVAAIIIWHFYFVIVSPREFPMSWSWISGKMPRHKWKEHHSRDKE